MTDQSDPPAPKCPYCDAPLTKNGESLYDCNIPSSNHCWFNRVMFDAMVGIYDVLMFDQINNSNHMRINFAVRTNSVKVDTNIHLVIEKFDAQGNREQYECSVLEGLLTRELVDRVLKMKAFW